MYEKIFNREAELRELFDEEKITEEQFLERRQQKVKPLFDNLHEWLLEKKNREILETSKTKQAINYCLNRWENLTRYLNYSYLTPSTNEAERTVRPFTLLRKNSFPGTLKLRRSSLAASGKMIKRKKYPVIGRFFFVQILACFDGYEINKTVWRQVWQRKLHTGWPKGWAVFRLSFR